jgi:AcrR family transcriptional regulator
VPRPKTHDEALRLKLLDRAGELIAEDGPKALSLRRLAADVRTSTTAVYSLFGGKPDLVNALYAEGFRRFGLRLAAVERTGDPVEDLVRLGLAYRDSALADPHLYSIMFSRSIPGFEPKHARTALGALADAVRAGIDAGVFADVDPAVVAVSSWGIVHGLVSLELNGSLPAGWNVGATYEAALHAHARGWTPSRTSDG